MKTGRRLTFWVMLRVFFRSFFIQSAMNYERMQNLGFAYVMEPAIRHLYPAEQWNHALQRHLVFFNSNPYLTAAIIGASLKLEEKHANGEGSAQDVIDFKQFMMGPIAALGDSFFWTSLKPLAASWAVLAALSGVLWAPIALLVLYNLVQVGFRVFGIFRGYRTGEEICLQLQSFDLVKLSNFAQLMIAVMLGCSGAIFVGASSRSAVSIDGPLEVFLFASLVLLFLLGVRRKLDATLLLYLYGLGTIIVVYLLDLWVPLT
ncbi:MAG: PTS system mannose/fructose/sorbose family transporter subunit IID [Bradymonadia bacterium]